MTRQEFIDRLNNLTTALPRAERERLMEYYGEIIDDRMEEGLSEEQAVAALGEPEALAGEYADAPRPAAPTGGPEDRGASSAQSVPALNGLRIRVDDADVTLRREALENGAAAQLRFSDPNRFEWRMDGDVMEITEKEAAGSRFSFQRVLHRLSSPAQRVEIILAGPLDGALDFSADGGDLDLDGAALAGGVMVESESGDVKLRTLDCGANLKLSSRSGDIRMEGVRVAGALRVRLASGDMKAARLAVSGDSCVDATSGDIELRRLDCQALSVTTASGDIEIEHGTAAATDIRATSGDVSLSALQCDPSLGVETANGDISLGRCVALDTRVKANNGDVSVRLAKLPCGYDINASTVSGDIRLPNDNPPALDGALQPKLALRTVSGDISVKIVE